MLHPFMTMQPNILILTADQLTQRAVGAYGAVPSHTPNLDTLAARGVAFANAYTPCPLCMPARAALWTGRLPHDTGILTNGKAPSIPANLSTLGDVFSQAGYICHHFGKTHDLGALRGFTVDEGDARPVEESPPWTNYWDTQCDRDTAEKAANFLDHHGAEPFVLAAEFNNPHDICLWVGDHIGAHTDTPVPGDLPPLPANFETPDLATRSIAIRYNCCSNFRVAQTLAWTPENFRHYLAAYNHYLRMLDRDLGRVLAALERRADAANTIIVFLADHGDGLASHRMVTKGGHFYEETTRVPLIIAGPGIPPQKSLTRAPLASLLDLFPTLCDGANIDFPAGLAGRSLAPWLNGQGPRDSRTHVISCWTGHEPVITPGRMLRTHRYKYTIFREDNVEEFYDLVADPGELHNLVPALDPRPSASISGSKPPPSPDRAQARALAEHRALLQTHCTETNDPFFSESAVITPPAHTHDPTLCPVHG